jgi:hypothetical protein
MRSVAMPREKFFPLSKTKLYMGDISLRKNADTWVVKASFRFIVAGQD